MPINETTNWSTIQSRAIDPFSLFKSANVNKLTGILGSDNGKLSGFEFEILWDEETDIIYGHYSSGRLLKDNVLINFDSDIYVPFGALASLDDDTYVTCLQYTYQIVVPGNIAQIVCIKESDYDSSTQMILHRVIKLGEVYPDSFTISEVEPYIFTYMLPDFSASDVDYDHSTSLLLSNNVQDAVDELDSMFDNILADDIAYDNSESGMAAITVQDAIDELEAAFSGIVPPASSVSYNNMSSELAAENVQSAIDELDSMFDFLSAEDVSYNNTSTELEAVDTQMAIDEIYTLITELSASDISYDNTDSGLTAESVQAAIDEVSITASNSSAIILPNQPVGTGVSADKTVVLSSSTNKWELVNGTSSWSGGEAWGIVNQINEDLSGDILFEGLYYSDLITAVGNWYVNSDGSPTQSETNFKMGYCAVIGQLILNATGIAYDGTPV